jgi:hypothetical protein
MLAMPRHVDLRSETGAVGWLLVGVLLGIVLVIWFLFSLIF